MSLTFSSGPLSGSAPETVNYRIDGPAHKLLMQAFPRRVRAVFRSTTPRPAGCVTHGFPREARRLPERLISNEECGAPGLTPRA